MNNSRKILVSVCVITYNSDKYIIETLDSIKQQTYREFELIISDDCSSDNTVPLCQRWIKDNAKLFIDIKLIESQNNTGVASNCNRAYKAASGYWIKCIAGDDLLLPDAVKTYLNFINKNPQCRICYGKPILFGSNPDDLQNLNECFNKEFHEHIKKNLKHQKQEILKRLFVPGPGLFVQRQLWEDVGGFDEAYPFSEEYPFILRTLMANNKIWWLGEYTIKYRLSPGSLSHGINNKVSYTHFKDNYRFFLNTRRILLIKRGYLLTALHQTIKYYIDNLEYLHSPKYKQVRFLQLLSPLWYIDKIKYWLK